MQETKTLKRWARWIVRRGENLPDHACNECVPGGEIVKPGFRCVFHEAVQVVESSGGDTTPWNRADSVRRKVLPGGKE